MMTSLDASPDDNLDEEELDPWMLGRDVKEPPQSARGYKPGAEGPSTVEQQAELGTGEAKLKLGSLEASGGEGTQLQLVSEDEEVLPLPPPNPRERKAERRQA